MSVSPRLVLTSSSSAQSFSISHLPRLDVGARVHVRFVLTTIGYGQPSSLLVLAEPGNPQAIFAAYWSDYVPNAAGADLPAGLDLGYRPDAVCGSIGANCGVSHTLEAEFRHDGQVTRVGRGKVVRAGKFLLGNGLSEDWEWGGNCTDTYDAKRLSGLAIDTTR